MSNTHWLGQLAEKIDQYRHDRVRRDFGQAEGGRCEARFRIRCSKDTGDRMIAEIEPGAFDWGVYDRQRLDALLAQRWIELCHCRDMAAAERAMQS